MDSAVADDLARFLERHPRLAVLSGAGCSTGSGIPEYRDDEGRWKHTRPVQYADFIRSAGVRRRYWARSYLGWRRIAAARPNAAHLALARLEERGVVETLITQNVDNLHRAAGSRAVIDLHGVLQKVRCLSCDEVSDRQALQRRLEGLNPGWKASVAGFAPDGDARIDDADAAGFSVPDCAVCGGILKPDVVFFGESVPKERIACATESVGRAPALLVVGSSLMVFSGYRYARAASAAGIPIAILNRGKTRADDLASHRYTGDCASLLEAATVRLAA